LEDTTFTMGDLERATSARTAELVVALTKPFGNSKLPRTQRNQKFVEQIVRAGATAMFIKVCDSLNNIGWPKQTPIDLLEKAIRKGRYDYMRFFSEGYLPEALRQQYLSRLVDAERQKNQMRLRAHQHGQTNATTLEEVIELCARKAESKVLERHDISKF